MSDSTTLKEITPYDGLHVSLANGVIIKSSAVGELPIPNTGISIPAYIFSDSTLQHNLLSIAALCNVGCKAIFTKTDITITKDDRIVYHGTKQPHDTLWNIDLQTNDEVCNDNTRCNSSAVNLSVRLDTDAEFVAFVHATLGQPTISTF